MEHTVEEAVKKACFLDRDGVIIREVNYIKSAEQVEMIPSVYEAFRLLREMDFAVIVVSNQSGVARGYFKEDCILDVQKKIDEYLAEKGQSVDAYYNCPHLPDALVPEYRKECSCRKPAPGMILKAALDFELDIKSSFIIGDKLSDLNAGKNAGCLTGILVRSGHGEKEAEKAEAAKIPVKSDILEAVRFFRDNFYKSAISKHR